ncbi:hypothetical protein CJ030_MR8G029124 [Morella rubra]|uniref:Uncharacterized protein n=1 Tax=Morella rubra TaxID=262757 RepID=A0A6A1UNQ6_9ROSI|nr:hypothetical protein CJ030_MR8G029120 [Morella rubra]KAB1202045.1 hypothetical protein CJ030_MR8G029124 [Morella rubra]
MPGGQARHDRGYAEAWADRCPGASPLEQSQEQQQITQNGCLVSLATIRDLESQMERLEGQIKKQEEEFSESLVSIYELEGQVESLERELEKQAQGFEEDIKATKCAQTEQEQRAI